MNLELTAAAHKGNVHKAWDVTDTNGRHVGVITQLHSVTGDYSAQGNFRADSALSNLVKSSFPDAAAAAEWLSKEARRIDKRDAVTAAMANR